MAGTARGFTWVELLLIIVIVIVLGVVLFPFFAKARDITPQNPCTNHQRQIAVGIQIYAQDNDEALPTADKVWSVIKLSRNAFICPIKGKSTPNAYAYNVNLSGQALGAFAYPTTEVMTMDSKNTNGGFNKFTGTSAPDCNNGPAANALLSSLSGQPLPNVCYDPGDMDFLRHGGVAIVSYLDGHCGESVTTPEADVDWSGGISANMNTPFYSPNQASTMPAPHTSPNTQSAPAGYGNGYTNIQPHLGSSISVKARPGSGPGYAVSKLGMIQGKVSWQFNNPATNVPITVGFGGTDNGGTAACKSLNYLYYAVEGKGGTVNFFQGNATGANTTLAKAVIIPNARHAQGLVAGATADTYVCTDLFSIERNGQIINFKKNGKLECSTSDTAKSPAPHGTTIPNAMMKMYIYVYCGDYKNATPWTANGAAPVANLGITNCMATGLQ